MTRTLEFTDAELAHIRAALILMRDVDDANSMEKDDECYRSAELSAEIIYRLELEGVVA